MSTSMSARWPGKVLERPDDLDEGGVAATTWAAAPLVGTTSGRTARPAARGAPGAPVAAVASVAAAGVVAAGTADRAARRRAERDGS